MLEWEEEGGFPISDENVIDDDADLHSGDNDELYVRDDHQEGIWINPSARRLTTTKQNKKRKRGKVKFA